MTLAGLSYIQAYAASGLPVLLSGGFPGVYAAANGSETATIKARLTHLSTSANVYTVHEGGISEKLASLGLSPRIKVETDGKWLTTWREDASSGVDYALVFCDSNRSSGYITVTGQAKDKVPYYMNAWTGDQEPAFAYNVTDSGLKLPVTLKGKQTLIIAFYPPGPSKSGAPKIHAVEAPLSVIGSTFEKREGWVAQVTNLRSDPMPESILLSNGRNVEMPQSEKIADVFNLTNWNLVAEHWEAPTDLYDAKTIAHKYNTTHELSALVSWSTIPTLTNTSGLGYYSTSFQWPPTNEGKGRPADGAYIVFPSILHAIQVSINGHRIPPLDYTDARADISKYLKKGKNDVLAVVPTTMWNYIRSILSDIRDQGHLPGLLTMGLPVPGILENGLIEEVSIIPFVNVRIPQS
jgi:hypothetical protein